MIGGGDLVETLACPNVSDAIDLVTRSRYATFGELATVLGTQDLYDLVEIVVVKGHNDRVIQSRREASNGHNNR